jgi:FMN phosphatase YigB (HAD superfamily)
MPAQAPPAALISDIGGVLVEDHWSEVARIIAGPDAEAQTRYRAAFEAASPRLDLGDVDLEGFRAGLEARGLALPSSSDFRTIVLEESLIPADENIALLGGLRRAARCRTVALSNVCEEIARAVDRKIRLDLLFEHVLTSCQLGFAKPDPRSFAAACRVTGVPPARSLFVDDKERNVRAAAALGFRADRVTTRPGVLQDVLESAGLLSR